MVNVHEWLLVFFVLFHENAAYLDELLVSSGSAPVFWKVQVEIVY